jgi:nitrate reductase cytochrome c-type subunit
VRERESDRDSQDVERERERARARERERERERERKRKFVKNPPDIPGGIPEHMRRRIHAYEDTCIFQALSKRFMY